MAFKKEEVFKKACEVAKKEEITEVQELVLFLPCQKSTFYLFFPFESEEMEAIKDILEDNKVKRKLRLKQKWERSDNASMEIVAFKLMATEEELRRINPPKDNQQAGQIEVKIVKE